ncbi:helix-turn-helix domain-containing protein [Pluralibacter gergoviae]|uniref:helix-turn-helix domain-containing protein n=1 Tax=Pluralibacter gergoviae TaxID=61647 RepID=UPI000AC0AD46|nr:helix-turn-helix domain-containing protein [Pluralibacter gergoviae]ELG9932600.1 helix-turn-helix domain-containing protein [Pluralibacter gergoviae]ELK5596568.1 helix-turn-helix domain-containing protein [Pluralibacter gergoviae]
MDDNKPVLLTLHEALRLDLIEAYMAREITLAEVAESMELTRRQCSRLIKRYRELGPAGLVSRRRGKPAPWKARQSSVKHHHQRSGTAAYSLTRPGYESVSHLANSDHRIRCPDFKRDRAENDDCRENLAPSPVLKP